MIIRFTLRQVYGSLGEEVPPHLDEHWADIHVRKGRHPARDYSRTQTHKRALSSLSGLRHKIGFLVHGSAGIVPPFLVGEPACFILTSVFPLSSEALPSRQRWCSWINNL